MSELRVNIGKKILVFLKNNFRYEGILLRVFDGFLEIDDFKSGKKKLVSVDSVAEAEYE